jgi:hypothetical protein
MGDPQSRDRLLSSDFGCGIILLVVLYRFVCNAAVYARNIPGKPTLRVLYVGFNWLLLALIVARYDVDAPLEFKVQAAVLHAESLWERGGNPYRLTFP